MSAGRASRSCAGASLCSLSHAVTRSRHADWETSARRFRLTAERQSTTTSGPSSSSTAYVVTSFSPHVVAVHEQGWTACEAHDAAVRASLALPPIQPARDRSGRFARSRTSASPAAALKDVEPVQSELDGEGGSPPPDTMPMKGGTLVPLVPLAPGPLVHVHVKRARPRRDKEHVNDEAWDAWTAVWWSERCGDEERGAARRKVHRDRVERMGGYGALRSWGWCEGLLEPVNDEDELPPVQELVEDVAAADPPRDPAALQRLVFEVVPSSIPAPPSPPPAVSSTQPRKRSNARPPAGRAAKRSRTAVDPEWRPTYAARSQRSATRSVAVLEDIDEGDDDDEGLGEGDGEPVADEDERGGVSSADDLPPLRQSSSVVHFPPRRASTLPLRSTNAALAPFTSSSRHASTASSTAPSPSAASSSPTASRDTSFSHDSTMTSDTSLVPSEGSPYPPAATAPPTPLRPLRPRPPLTPIHAPPPPPSQEQQQHSQKRKSKHAQRRSRTSQPRARRAPTSPPGVHASASAAAAEAHASAQDARSRLEEEAVWALMGMGWSASAARAREPSGGGEVESAGEVRAAVRGGGAQLWEQERWGV